MGVLKGLKPEGVFRYFEELSAIPRGSGNEAAAAAFVESFAFERGLKVYRDSADNVIISKNASAGYEDSPGVILQGHLDMVCEREDGCSHDFKNEGLKLKVEDGYVSAEGTTLGGDDGIAVAIALAVLDDDEIAHPPLECVFTTGEEIGLLGAHALDASVLKGRRLINIDSEEEGIFTVGCAGGMRSECILPAEYEETEGLFCTVTVDGLLGGHSGTEIDKGRANSNILMGRVLYALERELSFAIAEIRGGNTDNAVANATTASLYIGEEDKDKFERVLTELDKDLKHEYAAADPGLSLSFRNEGCRRGRALTGECTGKLVFLLHSVPDGVIRYSADLEGLVETSLNLGILRLDGDAAVLIFCVRSSVGSQKKELGRRLCHLTEFLGGTYVEKGDYPGWQYRKDSFLRDTCVSVYERMYKSSPEVVAIHAGLECGLFCEKLSGLECISIGPDLLDIHTPKERLSIPSTERVYEFVLEVLKALK